MGLLDFLFGRSTQQSDLKTNTKSDDNRVKEQKAQKSDNTIEPFVFKSNCHQRYENNQPVMGLQKCIRTVSVVKNTNGCQGYRLNPGIGYIVKIYNDDLGKPNMSDKPMKVVRKTDTFIELRGFPIEAMSPFGWQEVDYSDYGFFVYYKNGIVEKCVLHMYDRNIKIEYMRSADVNVMPANLNTPNFDNNISVKAVSQGCAFCLKFTSIQVIKQPYNGQPQKIPTNVHATAIITRNKANGITTFSISNIEELRTNGILQSNPSFTPSFTYNQDGLGNEFASAEIGNNFDNVISGKEYVSLFQITRQKGKLVAFIINNLPHIDDYYYLIILSE